MLAIIKTLVPKGPLTSIVFGNSAIAILFLFIVDILKTESSILGRIEIRAYPARDLYFKELEKRLLALEEANVGIRDSRSICTIVY